MKVHREGYFLLVNDPGSKNIGPISRPVLKIHRAIMILTPLGKAQAINNDFGIPVTAGDKPKAGENNYRGAIAEIGAGQEVARLFFEAFGTSSTIVKTMSAYGKGCSDAIYGKSPAYISEERLSKIIRHDFELLLTRELAPDEKPDNQELRYFTFANTVHIDRNGWAGVRIQTDGCALKDDSFHAREYRVHFEILAKDKITKMRIVGALGINLIYGAILAGSERKISNELFIASLMDNVETAHLRIDTVSIRKLKIKMDKSSVAQWSVGVEEIELERFGVLSRDMCIELVKTSTVKCAAFKKSKSSSTISHDIVGKGKYLAITSSACHTEGIPLQLEMLDCAKKAFLGHLQRTQPHVKASDIIPAIHLPILGVISLTKDLSEQYIYINRENEPNDNWERRNELIQGTSTDEIAIRVERIVKADCIALLSEFSATSEIIKFLRAKTRLGMNQPIVHEIALVLRADQLVMFLINIEERFKDRDPLEIIGSVLRRETQIYVYPCEHSIIFESQTLYGIPIKKAFSPDALKNAAERKSQPVTTAHLKVELIEKYSSLLSYIASEGCIHDLISKNKKFTKTPLRPQVQ